MAGRSRSPKREGNSESDIVNVAIKQLTPRIRDRLTKLFDEGLLKDNDLDLRSITVFASLNEGLQDRVMTHMENERIYVANARSKSGFLIATCDKAKTGCLDARGLGAIDPWRSALVAMATPKQYIHELEPERDWLDKQGSTPVKMTVNVTVAEKEAGSAKVDVVVSLDETCAAIKSKLAGMGIRSIPVNHMKFSADSCGFIKDGKSLAYYNLKEGTELELFVRKRAGSRFRRDHAVPLKQAKIIDRRPPAPVEVAAAPKLPGMPSLPALPGLPGLPGLPALAKPAGLPGLPALPGFPAGLPALGTMPAGLPALGTMPGLTGMAKAPGLPGMPGMPTMPGMSAPGAPGAPGAAPPSIDPSVLAKLGLPGLPSPGGMPKMPGMPTMPGMPGMPGMPTMPGQAPVGATPKGGMAS